MRSEELEFLIKNHVKPILEQLTDYVQIIGPAEIANTIMHEYPSVYRVFQEQNRQI